MTNDEFKNLTVAFFSINVSLHILCVQYEGGKCDSNWCGVWGFFIYNILFHVKLIKQEEYFTEAFLRI